MNNTKILIAITLIALIGVVGGTFAYFTSTSTLNNEFQTGTYATSVKEEFVSPDNWTPGTTTQKTVNVTNNGSVDIAVRASYVAKWTAEDGTVLSGLRNNERVAQFSIGSDWQSATDGYYYYKNILASGQTSSNFISSVTFNPNFVLEEDKDIKCTTINVDGKTTVNCVNLTSGYAGAVYTLDITIETIQADKKWNYAQGSPKITFYEQNEKNGSRWFYNAEKGMTWKEWASSKYNTDSFSVTATGLKNAGRELDCGIDMYDSFVEEGITCYNHNA